MAPKRTDRPRDLPRRRRPARPGRRSPILPPEILERRFLPATFVVTNTSDSGPGSLRQEILDDDDSPNPAGPIDFEISGPGVQTIFLFSALPAITKSGIIIDGTSQPFYAGTPLIELDGTAAGGSADGLDLDASGLAVTGLDIVGFSGDGVAAQDAAISAITIVGNYIGVDPSGNVAIANAGYGVYLDGVSGAAVTGNVISGNTSSGIALDGTDIQPGTSGVMIQGNKIGTDAGGGGALPNGAVGQFTAGIDVGGSAGNTIGGTLAGQGNLISGNADYGILIESFAQSASGNLIQGNTIGTDVGGSTTLGHQAVGIAIESAGNTVGGTTPSARNLISGNSGEGVSLFGAAATDNVISGNEIGTNLGGSAAAANGVGVVIDPSATFNTIGGTAAGSGNVISGNGGDGIDVAGNSTLIEGNNIGIGAGGASAIANGASGIYVTANGTTIGGTTASARNVISGNKTYGIADADTGTRIEGNYIGTNAAGTGAVPNHDGIKDVGGGGGGTIGGTAAGSGNVISGNTEYGINAIFGGDVIEGNFIGTDYLGSSAVPNATGVYIFGTFIAIGGSTPNVISGNTNYGIDVEASNAVIQGDVVGTNADGTIDVPNATDGIYVAAGAATIGGLGDGQGNLIAGNDGDGVLLQASGSGSLIEGNTIGIDGDGNVANQGTGIEVAGSASNTIGSTTAIARNVIAGTGFSIYIHGSTATANVVEGNYLGTNADGSASAYPTASGVGVYEDGAPGNTIGGAVAGDGNLISGNVYGVWVQDKSGPSAGTVIEGNDIGTDSSGMTAVSNEFGVEINASSITVGGVLAGDGNIISGNSSAGIELDGTTYATNDNLIAGNRVGLNAAGAPLGNAGNGIQFNDDSSANTIGGTTAAAANTIVDNSGYGVSLFGGLAVDNVVEGNFIGTDAAGDAGLGNAGGGVDIDAGLGDTIGGTAAGSANVISANGGTGVTVTNETVGDAIEGNFIGVDSTGGKHLGNAGDGIDLDQAGNDVVSGNIISANAKFGIESDETAGFGDSILGNRIGTYSGGNASFANASGGIDVSDGDATIGGTAALQGNQITGNSGPGIMLDPASSGSVIEGNFIGTDTGGDTGLGNANAGLLIQGADNTIGGAAAGAGNVISGNDGGGIVFSVASVDPSGNVVEGNRIGTTPDGQAALGNFGLAGIDASDGATGNTIGGALAADGNTISGNFGDGIYLGDAADDYVILNNVIGDTLGNGNGIELHGSADNVIGEAGAGNSIADNAGDGIDIEQSPAVAIVGAATFSSGQFVDPSTFFAATAPYGPPTATQYYGTSITFDLNTNEPLNPGATGTLSLDLYNLSGNATSGNFITALLINGHNVVLNPVQSGDPYNTVEDYSVPVSLAAGTISPSGVSDVEIDYASNDSAPGAAGLDYAKLLVSSPADGNVIQGNAIGTDSTFDPGLGNQADGISDSSGGNLIGAPLNTSGTSDVASGNVIVANGGFGIELDEEGDDQIRSNFIGTDPAGGHGLGNADGGIHVLGSLGDNQIGAPDDLNADGSLKNLHGNVISGNDGAGLEFDADGYTSAVDLVEGNLIGTDPTGEGPLGNAVGVLVNNGLGLTIGNSAEVDDLNVISGNSGSYLDPYTGDQVGGDGVVAENSNSLVIENDRIGTNITGTSAVANSGDGVAIESSNLVDVGVGLASPLVGGDLISGNGIDGVLINGSSDSVFVVADLIGTDAAGSSPLPNAGDGVTIDGSSDSTVGGTTAESRNLISGNAGYGVAIEIELSAVNTGDVVEGNFIGTDATGKAAVGNTLGGVLVSGATTQATQIGGTSPGAGNLISGNTGAGVALSDATQDDAVAGDLIGTDLTGTLALPNADDGVLIESGATLDTVGGATAADRNVISGNGGGGVVFDDADTSEGSGDLLQGNYIGTDVTGTRALGNAVSGVYFTGFASRDTVGGTTPGDGNVISGNMGGGIDFAGEAGSIIIEGNFIGTDAKGTSAVPNVGSGISFSSTGGHIVSNVEIGESTPGARNVISGNTSAGIDIASDAAAIGIYQNFIGTDATGMQPLGNGNNGVAVDGGTSVGVSGIFIGSSSEGNTIAFADKFKNVIADNGTAAAGVPGVAIDDATAMVDVFDDDIRDNSGEPIGGLGAADEASNVVVTAQGGGLYSASAEFTGLTPNEEYDFEFLSVGSGGVEGQLLVEGQLFSGPFTSGNPSVIFQATLPADAVFTATITEFAAGSTSQYAPDASLAGQSFSTPVAVVAPTLTAALGVPVRLDGSASYNPDGLPLTTYAWDFGDGTTGTGPDPIHTYRQAGDYTATLYVSDAFGHVSAPASESVTVVDTPPSFDPSSFGEPTTYPGPGQAATPGDGFGEQVVAIRQGDVDAGGSVLAIAAPTGGPDGSGLVYLDSTVPIATSSKGGSGTAAITIADPSPAAGDRFGSAMAAVGNLLGVGAPGAAGGGVVYLFDADPLDVTYGALLATIRPPATSGSAFAGSDFGGSLAGDGTRLLVGGPGAVDNGGVAPAAAAYVFDADPGSATFGQLALRLTLSGASEGGTSGFGTAVASTGADLLLTAPGADEGLGVAYEFDAVSGALVATFSNPSPEPDGFGASIADAGPVILVGAPGASGGAGEVDLFDPSAHLVTTTLTDPFGDGGGFGSALAGGASTVLVGAPSATLGNGDSGAVFEFDVDPSSPTFGQPLSTLADPKPTTGQDFGASVALLGGDALVGVPGLGEAEYVPRDAPLDLGASTVDADPAGGPSVVLSGRIDEAGTGPLYALDVDVDWGDGSPDTLLSLAPGVLTFAAPHRYATPFQGEVVATVTDQLGAPGTAEVPVTVNAAAKALEIDPVAPVAEGDAADLDGHFTDPALAGPPGYVIDWGDGVTTDGTFTADPSGGFDVDAAHPYDQPSPEGMPYEPILFVVEGSGSDVQVLASAMTPVVVTSVSPVVTSLALDRDAIAGGSTVTLTGDFFVPDPDDTHTVSIDWGDGSGPTTLYLAPGGPDQQFSTTHPYLVNPPVGASYTIQVSVSGPSGGPGTAATSVTMTHASPQAFITVAPGANPGPSGRVELVSGTADTSAADLASATYSWSVLGGPTGTGPGFEYSPTGPGDSDVVTLTVTDADGVSSTAVALVVYQRALQADLAIPTGASLGRATEVIVLNDSSKDTIDGSDASVPIVIDGGPGSGNVEIGGPIANTLISDGADSLFGGTGPNLFEIHLVGNDPYIAANAEAENTLDFSSNDYSSDPSSGVTVTLNGDPGPQAVDDNNDVVVLAGTFQQLDGSSDGADDLTTGPGNVTVVAGKGNASVRGGAGNDVVFAAPAGGTTTVMAGSGNTSVHGGSGNDVTFGGPAGSTTTVMAGSGNTSLRGGGGNDVVFGGPAGSTTTVTPGSGNTSVNGAAGNDVTFGGPSGSRTVVVGGSGTTTVNASMNGGSGNDVVFGGPAGSTTTVTAGSGTTSVRGGGGNDVVFGGPAGSTTTVTAGSGTTSVRGGGGNDVVFGGPAGSTTNVNGGSGTTTVHSGSGSTSVKGGTGNDVIFGGPGDVMISGGMGDDMIVAGSGNDTIVAGSGNDMIFGGPTPPGSTTVGSVGGHNSIVGGMGNDVIFDGPGGSIVRGGTGNTTVVAGSGDDTIYGGAGVNSIVGGSGNDTIFAAPAPGGPTQPPSKPGTSIKGGSGNDVVYGGPNTVLVEAGSGSATIYGFGYDDPSAVGTGGVTTIEGGEGPDVIFGGVGDNDIVGGSADTTIHGGYGDNTIEAGSGDTTIYGGAGVNSIVGGSGNDTIFAAPAPGGPTQPPSKPGTSIKGGSGNDVVYGGPNTVLVEAGSGSATIYGFGYDDPSAVGTGGVTTIEGGEGPDVIFGGVGDNDIVGGSATNVIHGGTGDNTIQGGQGDNTIYGGPLDDMILAGPANDLIFAGPGADEVRGGGGVDTLALAVNGRTTLTDSSLTFSDGGGTIVDTFSGIQQASLVAGPGDDVIDASAFSGSSTLVAGAGDDTLIGSVGGSSLVAGRGDDSLVGGPGANTFAFGGSTLGADSVSVPSGSALDTLDFSGLDSAIVINLGLSTPQPVSPAANLTLTLSDPSAIEDLVGTVLDDTIRGNDANDDLIGDGGLDMIVGGTGDDTLQGGSTQVVYLDFDTAGTPSDHVYSPADRASILGILEQDYADFQYTFVATPPSSGPYATLYFNPPSLGADEGGIASGIDARNLDKGDYADISVAGLLGNAGEPADTDANFVTLTGEVAAHELGHLSGLLHGDSFGPIGSGIAPGVSPSQFYPAFPGPAVADQSADHILASPASIGTTIQDAIGGTFFGEREDIVLAFDDHGAATYAESADHSSAADAEPIALTPLSVSNSDLLNQDLGKVYQVGAADVVGQIGPGPKDGQGNVTGIPNFYAIQGTAGDLLNLQVYSRSLARIPLADQIDSILDVYYYVNGNLVHVPYYGSIAHDDDSFQDQDASIVDLPLPTTGTYYVEVSTYPDDGLSIGDYELFMYTFTPPSGQQAAEPPSAGGDTLYGGSGKDLIITSAGDDTIEDDPSRDVVIFGSGNYHTTVSVGPIELRIRPSVAVDGSGDVDVDEGTAIAFTGSYFDPDFLPDTPSWQVTDALGNDVADGSGTTFDFTPPDGGDYTVTFSVSDADKAASTSIEVVAAYVAPTVSSPSDQTAFATESQAFVLGTYTAPSGTIGYSVDVNWGDQSADTTFAAPSPSGPTPASLGSADHDYAEVGDYTVTVSVSQDGQAAVSETFQVVVKSPNVPVDLVSIAPVSPADRTSAVSTVVVAFSGAVRTPFDPALSLTLDGSGLSTASLTESPDPAGNFAYDIAGLASLTTAEGQYILTLNPTKVIGSNGIAGTGPSQSVSWIVDRTPPTSKVTPFPSSQGTATATSLTFAVSATGSDPAPSAGVVTSGVAYYEFFSSIDGGTFSGTPFAKVPADAQGNGSATFSAQSNHTYGFYSLAIDGAGNVEVKSPRVESAIYVPDLSPPVTTVTSVKPVAAGIATPDATPSGFLVAWSGSDVGSSGLAGFTLYESVDGGSPIDLGLFYANPGTGGVSTGSAYIPGDPDGSQHTYTFWTDGVDRAGNVQADPPASGKVSSTQTFAASTLSTLQATGLLVQDGAASRSYIRYLNIDFNSLTDAALESLITGKDVTLIHHPLSGVISANDPSILLNGAANGPAVTAIDHQIEVDFGASGIGGSAGTTAPDGYYEIDVVLPSGVTQKLFFYRLLGDVDGSQVVDQGDLSEIAASLGQTGIDLDADVNGDKIVNASDNTLASRSRNHKLGTGPGSLHLDG